MWENIFTLRVFVFTLSFLSNLDFSMTQQLICETGQRSPQAYPDSKISGDGGFMLTVSGPLAANGSYVPNEVYEVSIGGSKTRYSVQTFMEFLIVAESEKQAMMGKSGLITTGIFHVQDDSLSRYSDLCPEGVMNSNLLQKSEVSVLWTAPSVLVASCVTFKATVVERPRMWFMDDDRLSFTLCPHLNNKTSGDKTAQRANGFQNISSNEKNEEPKEEQKCCACDDAKYEVIFEGLWSRETHPKDFPDNKWLLHFSDIIGASHSKNYHVWKEGEVATDGIRHVAEWGSTRQLEIEMKQHSRHINTIIKARGLWHPNEKGRTSAAFRVDKRNHLMSLVSMIGPSPDWIVGISGLDLCLKNCSWLDELTFELYPYDAGTDNGISYMSPNDPTEPRGKIKSLTPTDPADPRSPFVNEDGNSQFKPFAKALIRRQRIYPKDCADDTVYHLENREIVISENTEENNRPECEVSSWTEWSDCSVTCGKGLRMRKRWYVRPVKADMMLCDRQLIEKEMCLGSQPTCHQRFDEDLCAVTDWTDWTPCSAECGEGTTSRSRRYKNHLGMKKCTLEIEQTKSCIVVNEGCDPKATKEQIDADCPMSPWSAWSPCNVSCGHGIRERSRFLLTGRNGTLQDKCYTIPLKQSVPCEGELGPECRISMEEARQICILPNDQGPCRSNLTRYFYDQETGICKSFEYGGCRGNRNRFESRDQCEDVCAFLRANRLKYQPQIVAIEPLNTLTLQTSPTTISKSSEATTEESIKLLSSTESASDIVHKLTKSSWKSAKATNSIGKAHKPTNLNLGTRKIQLISSSGLIIEKDAVEVTPKSNVSPVDCIVSSWKPWSPCSVSCGRGFKIREREILVRPQNNGKRCPRRMKRRKLCYMPSCIA